MDLYRALAFLLYMVVLVSAEETKDGYETRYEFGSVETFLETSSYVYHLEEDKFTKGNILYSDQNALKTTDGVDSPNIAGMSMWSGYEEGVGDEARFNTISGFCQVNSSLVVVVDNKNHCLRLVDRIENETALFVGNCTHSGFRDGFEPLFNKPWAVVKIPGPNDFLLVSDLGNHWLRIIDLITSEVRIFGIGETYFSYPTGLWFNQSSTRPILYMSNKNSILELDDFLHPQLVIGQPRMGNDDGTLKQATFNSLRGLTAVGKRLVVADRDNHAVRVIDLENNRVETICSGIEGDRDGNRTICQLNNPYSVAFVAGDVYIGQQKAIRRLKLDHKICKNKQITIELPYGRSQAKVEIYSGVTISLFPGVYNLRLPDDCNAQVIIRTDRHLKKRVDFKTNYDADCKLLSNPKLKSLINVMTKYRNKQIDEICSGACKMSSDYPPSHTCIGNKLTVTWPTDIILESDTEEIPANIDFVVKKNLADHRNLLDIVIFTHSPPVIYPNMNDDELPAKLSLTKVCLNGLKYSRVTRRCQ